MLIGFSQYTFHSDKIGGLKMETISSTSELLIELDEHSKLSALDEIKQIHNLDIQRAFNPMRFEETDLDDYYLVDIPDNSAYSSTQILNRIKKYGVVDWVEYNENINLSPTVELVKELRTKRKANLYNDKLSNSQWSFDLLQMNQFFETINKLNHRRQKTSLLVILDTGIDSKHEDLIGNYRSIEKRSDSDGKGHGTHCAGIAAAVTNNSIGIASFVPDNKWVTVSSVKVLNKYGSGTQAGIINGIIKATDAGADVISLSLGARANQTKERAYKQAIEYANNSGAIVIVAAGNSNLNANTYSPANTKAAITVSAVDIDGNKAGFSNYFSDMTYGIAAPGVDILSTIPDNKYTKYSGTSMATPHVAGLVAIMKSLKPDITTAEVFQILNVTGKETNDTKRTGRLINPSEALNLLMR